MYKGELESCAAWTFISRAMHDDQETEATLRLMDVSLTFPMAVFSIFWSLYTCNVLALIHLSFTDAWLVSESWLRVVSCESRTRASEESSVFVPIPAQSYSTLR